MQRQGDRRLTCATRPTIEDVGQDETETFQKIADPLAAMGQKVEEQEGRAVRVSHANSTALLSGELIVDAGLPPELAQGVASPPGRYDSIIVIAIDDHLHVPRRAGPDYQAAQTACGVTILSALGLRHESSNDEFWTAR